MMRLLIEYAQGEQIDDLRLNAQVSAQPFYQGFGFVADSDIFTEAGIEHRHMTLNLAHNHSHTQETT
jgi:predicted GNAT family N-acyltransferase